MGREGREGREGKMGRGGRERGAQPRVFSRREVCRCTEVTLLPGETRALGNLL